MVKQKEFHPGAETKVDFEDDGSSLLVVEASVNRHGLQFHLRRRHHHPSCQCNHLGLCVRVRRHTERSLVQHRNH